MIEAKPAKKRNYLRCVSGWFGTSLAPKTRLARREGVFAVLLFLAAESVYAEWVKVASTDDITIYVDPDTIPQR